MRLSPLDPLHYAMLGTRAFTHLATGEHAEAADWAKRAAYWAGNARQRNAALTREDFFRAFPMKMEGTRERVRGVLERYGF
jgi:hypothetical protein